MITERLNDLKIGQPSNQKSFYRQIWQIFVDKKNNVNNLQNIKQE